jgi:uncharacterized protein YoxC
MSDENMAKAITNFIQKTNIIGRFQLFTKRTHYILFGVSIFTLGYTTFSFLIHKNVIKLKDTMENLRNFIRFDINDTREKHRELLSKIETIIDNIEEHHDKLDECKTAIQNYNYFILEELDKKERNVCVQNTSSVSDACTQTEENIGFSIITEDVKINAEIDNEIDNECYDIIPCCNVKKYHFI